MFLLMLGGALGTLARYGVGRWAASHWWGREFFFLGTLFVNVSGSFALGVAAVILLDARLPPHYQNWFLLVGTGFCGGFTTFSTFQWETYQLVRDGSWWLALAYVFGSVLAGFLGIVLAVALVHGLFPRQ